MNHCCQCEEVIIGPHDVCLICGLPMCRTCTADQEPPICTQCQAKLDAYEPCDPRTWNPEAHVWTP